jgi:hypothetical protein
MQQKFRSVGNSNHQLIDLPTSSGSLLILLLEYMALGVTSLFMHPHNL